MTLNAWTRLSGRLMRVRQRRAVSAWLREAKRRGCSFSVPPRLTGRVTLVPDRISWGDKCIVEEDVVIWLSGADGALPSLKVGARSFLGRGTYLGVHHAIDIGRDVLIGAYSYIISANHRFDRRDVPIREQGFTGATVQIADDAWLGTHVVILAGVTIGRGAVIGAGSVVTHDVPDYQIWGGVPARFIKDRP